MDNSKLDKFNEIMKKALYAPNKASAEPHIQSLEFLASELNQDITEYLSGILNETIIAIRSASGSVQNKEQKKGIATRKWHSFENKVRDFSDENDT